MSIAEVSPFVPRGPVADALHKLRDAVVLAVIAVVISSAGAAWYATRTARNTHQIVTKVNELQAENAKLRATAAENQRQADARALAGQQALAYIVTQLGQASLTPAARQAVTDVINAAIDQTVQNLRRQGITVTPVPRVTLPSPGASPGAPPMPSPPAHPVPPVSPAVSLQVQCLPICPRGTP